jgi:hypothetical protein
MANSMEDRFGEAAKVAEQNLCTVDTADFKDAMIVLGVE